MFTVSFNSDDTSIQSRRGLAKTVSFRGGGEGRGKFLDFAHIFTTLVFIEFSTTLSSKRYEFTTQSVQVFDSVILNEPTSY